MRNFFIAASIVAVLVAAGDPKPDDAKIETCLARVKDVHGGAGPWAIVGYRMGERALRDLKLPRHSFALMVVHQSPREVQYSCMADGLQAATGASTGKLNLKLEETPVAALRTLVEDRKTGRTLAFTIKPEFAKTITNLPYDHFEEVGRRIAGLDDDAMFTVEEIHPARVEAPAKP
jgi:formylmethanofuran dehydrogenase subunit E